jgi:hypothetical protein
MNLIIGTAAGAFSLDDPTTPFIAGTRINHIARSGEDWWALDGKSRIHHNGDVIATGSDGIALNCVQPTPSTVWVGATGARLFRLEDGHLVEDDRFASAPGREGWYTPWGGPPDVRSMAVDTAGPLYVNVHVGGILRYDEDGITPTIDQDSDVHQVIAHPSKDGVVLAACARGMAQSSNGRDFQIRAEGLHASYCRAVAIVGDVVLLSASTGPRTSRARLYRASLSGGPFQECRDGLPEWFDDNLDTHCLAVLDGSVFAGHRGTLWRSEDQGEQWLEVASGLPDVISLG